LLGDGTGDTKRTELGLDEHRVVSEFEHGHRESMSPTQCINSDDGGLPFVMLTLNFVRKTSEMTVRDIRNASPYGEATIGELMCQPEHDATLQRLAEGRRSA
jgi:hypothetical protein